MTEATYLPPVDKLLTYGKCHNTRNWPDYVAKLGFTAEHIPDLVRLLADKELNSAPVDSKEVWAPAHAWRTLAQLKAVEAISPLISMFNDMEGDDWFSEEIPQVFAVFGESALVELTDFLADSTNLFYPRLTAGNCIVKIGQAHPDLRTRCVEILTGQLAKFKRNSPELNGFLIADLLDLEAIEATELMEQAFASKRVDTSIAGDWLDIQVELGLKNKAEVYQLRHTVDAEQLGTKAIQPPKPQGFGKTVPESKKSKSK